MTWSPPLPQPGQVGQGSQPLPAPQSARLEPAAEAHDSSAQVDVLGEAHDVAFNAMGTFCHVVVHGSRDLLDHARRRVEELEQRWSRFLPTSEISRINESHDQPTAVSSDTYLLIYRATEAWRLTEGLYDPTILPALVAAGYDRSYSDPSAGVHRVNEPARPSSPSPGCAAIELDATLRTVRMPAGVQFDGGGIGKGLAVDLIVEELLDAGATGACVNLGGDLRVGGLAPTAQGWILGVADPYNAELIIPVRIDDGAVVTSTRLLRRWDKCGRTFHHLIDPRTGLPSASDVDAVTVVAGRAWWAEVLAKAALIAGMPHAAELLARGQVTGLVAAGVNRYYELDGWVDLIAS